MHLFFRGAGLGDCNAWRPRRNSGVDEIVGQRPKMAPRHVNDQCCILRKDACPLWRKLHLPGGMVRRCQNQFRCGAAVCKRRLQVGGNGKGRRNAWNNLERYPGLPESLNLFTGASEDERIARFQSEDRLSCLRPLNHQDVNLSLRNARLAAALAHGNDLRGLMRKSKNLFGDKVIWKDQVRSLKKPKGAKGEIFGISRTSSGKINMTALSFRSSRLA